MAKLNPKDATPIKRSRRDEAPEKPSIPYGAMPASVTGCPSYAALSDAAVRLLYELVRLHDGYNNGALFLSYRSAAERGLKSRAKVSAAFDELVSAGFIAKAREASREENRAACYALLWLPASRYLRDGIEKAMPLLPSPYPINRFLVVAPVSREKTLRGQAKLNRMLSVQQGAHGNEQKHSIGTDEYVPPHGNGLSQKTAKPVCPDGTGFTAPRDRLSRPTTQGITAPRYSPPEEREEKDMDQDQFVAMRAAGWAFIGETKQSANVVNIFRDRWAKFRSQRCFNIRPSAKVVPFTMAVTGRETYVRVAA